MNVLFLTQVLPYPLNAGPKVRAYYMLRHLAGRHRVTLVSFVRPDDRPEYVAGLRDGHKGPGACAGVQTCYNGRVRSLWPQAGRPGRAAQSDSFTVGKETKSWKRCTR